MLYNPAGQVRLSAKGHLQVLWGVQKGAYQTVLELG